MVIPPFVLGHYTTTQGRKQQIYRQGAAAKAGQEVFSIRIDKSPLVL
jgi:hypothetical protein